MNGKIEYVGIEDLFEEEQFKLQDFANKAMEKITELSEYRLLKVSIKTHGPMESHKKKFEIILHLSRGGKVIQLRDENKEGGKWNPVKTSQELLKTLVEKVKQENQK